MNKENILWLPTSELKERMHPDNPQVHTEDNDLPKIRHSLLNLGWLQYVTIQEDGNVLSGHGRILSADWLSQQDDDYFEQAWRKWENTDGRKSKVKKHQDRFCADYWLKCPVITTDLDDISQKAALIRLNDHQSDGVADPAKIAALLAQMKKPQQELSGWDTGTAKSFISAYVIKKAELPEIEQEAEEELEDNFDDEDNEYLDEEDNEDYLELESELSDSDFEGKQYFEREDATVYSKDKNIEQPELARVDVSNLNDEVLAENASAAYNPDISEQTRLLVYLDKEVLPEFKDLISSAADKLNIEKEGLAQQWRSQTLLAAVKYIVDKV